jgi:prevent-host-death family protein
MREVQSSEAKAHLTQLLSAVEHGESFTITRHGRPVAHLVPAVDQRRAAVLSTMQQIATFRAALPNMALTDILGARHERHRY